MKTSRRNWLRTALLLPAGAWMSRYQALAEPAQKKVKITAIKAMQVRRIAGNCLIKIETDQGLVGYGEAGATGPMARAFIEAMTSRRLLIGKDPLSIGYHFHEMISLMHTYRPDIPTVSGIDMALWDLAGKITGLPLTFCWEDHSVTPFVCIRTRLVSIRLIKVPAGNSRSA